VKNVGTLENERGVALITVILVVTLLTIAVTEFTYSTQLDAYRAQNARQALQASLLARSGVNLAEGFLMLDDDPKYDAFTEDWFLKLQDFCGGLPIGDNMAIRCDVKDESGKINVNLTRGVKRTQANQNEVQVGPDTILRDAVECIFHNRNIGNLGGQEINDRLADYWEQEPQTLPDGRQQQIPDFSSLEDFGAQFGLTAQDLKSLRPLLTAQRRMFLPTINANTAPLEVLQAVLNTENNCADLEEAQQIYDQARDTGFQNRGDLNAIIGGLPHGNVIGRLLGVTSSLYRLESSAIANYDPDHPDGGGIGQTVSVLVRRTPDPKHPQPETGTPGWTLRAIDWQKEGGARLFWEQPPDDGEEDAAPTPDDES
jgi:type II secretory pathway component PulK